jgi:hypothetical protein
VQCPYATLTKAKSQDDYVAARNASVTADFRLKSGGIKQQLVRIALFILGQAIPNVLRATAFAPGYVNKPSAKRR